MNQKDPAEEFLDKLQAEYDQAPLYVKIVYHMQEQMFLTLVLAFSLGGLFGYYIDKFTGFWLVKIPGILSEGFETFPSEESLKL